MPRRASYIPLSHDDYVPHAFRPIVRIYRGGPSRMDAAALERVKAGLLLPTRLTFPQFARRHGYSAPGLRRVFIRETGMTIAQWRAHGASTKPVDGSVADPP